jgi:hypothetical protein
MQRTPTDLLYSRSMSQLPLLALAGYSEKWISGAGLRRNAGGHNFEGQAGAG